MAEARRMGKSELFSHFADRFEVKRTQAREFFDELNTLAEKELKRSGEFVLPGMVKLVVQKRKARMGRNPATGEAIKIPAKTVVKARIAKQLKDAVLPASSPFDGADSNWLASAFRLRPPGWEASGGGGRKNLSPAPGAASRAGRQRADCFFVRRRWPPMRRTKVSRPAAGCRRSLARAARPSIRGSTSSRRPG